LDQALGYMTGKLCLITGASSGIGKEAAVGLAALGAHVVLVARDRKRGEAAVAEIQSRSARQAVDLMLADLSSQQSIRELAAAFKASYPRLDVLVNNAGLIISPRQLTGDGIEQTFALNHLGYFLLTNLLLEHLKASAPARIINVASEAQRGGILDFGDLQGAKRYSSFRAYSQSKLANIVFTYELAKRLAGTGVTVNAVHPGAVATNFGASALGGVNWVVTLAKPFMLTAAQGADTLVYLAASPVVEGATARSSSHWPAA